uniref:PDZ domain-containing protein n=1 Tax=Schistocephalus solidus TaxID=70667 RepID=A0A0X3Q142_SCHSO
MFLTNQCANSGILRRDSGIFSHEVYYYEPVEENEFDNLQRKYGELSGEIVTVEIVLQDIEELVKTTKARGLGISLCGNRDLNQMAVLVCGLRPGGIADLDGRINVGDQLLELNDHVLYGRSHLNAAPIILSSYSSMLSKATDRSKQGNSQALRFVIRRLPENLTNLACPPITYPSMSQKSSRKSSAETALNASSTTSQQLYPGTPGPPAPGRSIYEEVHVARLLRGKNGFGFAIMDKSFTNEPGIYIKQLVENGPAMLNGTLRAGDRIIRVDWHDALHANYESVLEWLRSARHQVRIVVSRVRLGSRTQRPSDDSVHKLGLRKRLSVPALSSLFSAFIHHSSKKTSMQSTSSPSSAASSCEPSNSLGDEMPPKKLDLLSPDIVSLDLRRASCPEQFAPGFAKKLARRSFLGVVPMASLTQLADPPLIVPPLSGGGGSKTCTGATGWHGISVARNASKHTAARHPILPGQENYIEIARNLAPSLGVSLIGGLETSLGVLQIHEIFPQGVLAKDGRLQPGDRIIAVNHQRLSNMSFENAVSTIVHAFSGLQPIASDADLATLATRTATCASNNPGNRADYYVSLVVERPAGVQTKWYDQEVTVDLLKRPGRGLGICIAERTGPASRSAAALSGGGDAGGAEKPAIAPAQNGLTSGSKRDQAVPTETTSLGVIISDLIKGSIAHTDGRIVIGDQILYINDIDVQNSSREEVATLLKAAQGKITLRLGRLKNQTRLLSAASAFVCCQRQSKKEVS